MQRKTKLFANPVHVVVSPEISNKSQETPTQKLPNKMVPY